MTEKFIYNDERFADIEMLRYPLLGFEALSLQQKLYIYCLSEATLYGRDITFDQFGRYNLVIRKTLEAVLRHYEGDRTTKDFLGFETYLKQVWFASGIHHHYGCEKFVPTFSEDFLRHEVLAIDPEALPLAPGQTTGKLLDAICPVLFDPQVLPKRVNIADGEDLVKTSACNYYQGVTQQEAEDYYAQQRGDEAEPPSWGLNTTLVKRDGQLQEEVWKIGGKYSAAIEKIVYWLEKAREYAEGEGQRRVIDLLIHYYQTGDLRDFDRYSIAWVSTHEGSIDFINGFIEVYGDPLGLKGSWEGIVEYRDEEATRRTRAIADRAQWFEDHSPVDPRFRKPKVKGVSANAVCAAMLGGDEYPASAIGINLPNADWIRAQHGSKSVTITNLTHAYDEAARGNGFREEFIPDDAIREMVNAYGDRCDDLHTDLHECLGHGSGRLLPGVSAEALRNYGSTIEEARADLFGLYFLADPKLVALGLLPNQEAHHAQYYSYMLNGLMTQLVRIKPGLQLEEAHMRNRALIARWALQLAQERQTSDARPAVELTKEAGKTVVKVNDYEALRHIFADELAEIQRIKSEGDYEAARRLVEQYGVKVEESLHQEVLDRYAGLHLAPYKGFINPRMTVVRNEEGQPTDVALDYTESYTEQMLRYGRDYGVL
mgnify:FL=1